MGFRCAARFESAGDVDLDAVKDDLTAVKLLDLDESTELVLDLPAPISLQSLRSVLASVLAMLSTEFSLEMLFAFGFNSENATIVHDLLPRRDSAFNFSLDGEAGSQSCRDAAATGWLAAKSATSCSWRFLFFLEERLRGEQGSEDTPRTDAGEPLGFFFFPPCKFIGNGTTSELLCCAGYFRAGSLMRGS